MKDVLKHVHNMSEPRTAFSRCIASNLMSNGLLDHLRRLEKVHPNGEGNFMVNPHAECLPECEVKHSYILQSADHIFIGRSAKCLKIS